MRRLLLIAVGLLLGADSPPSLVFLKQQQPTARLVLGEILQTAPAGEVTVTDPHDGRPHRYKAVRLVPLLERVYGATWKAEADLIFKAADGYEASLSTGQIAAGNPWLAFDAAQGPFRIENVNQHEVVELGPFYLIWEHGEPGGQWPYQVVTIDRSRFEERYPGLSPAPGSPIPVKRGFEIFRQHCIYCHSLRGQGGTSSFDLVSPRNVTRYLPGEYLRAFIADPSRFHGQSKMPPLSRDLPDHKQVVEDLLEYLSSFPE